MDVFVIDNDFLVVYYCSCLLPCTFTNLLITDVLRHYLTLSSVFTSILLMHYFCVAMSVCKVSGWSCLVACVWLCARLLRGFHSVPLTVCVGCLLCSSFLVSPLFVRSNSATWHKTRSFCTWWDLPLMFPLILSWLLNEWLIPLHHDVFWT